MFVKRGEPNPIHIVKTNETIDEITEEKLEKLRREAEKAEPDHNFKETN